MEFRDAVVLLVDDDAADRELTRRALARGGIQTTLFEVRNGEEALDYLHQRGAFEDPGASPRPDLILLDLNMPRMNGKEFLSAVADTPFAQIPVVVLTTSDAPFDVDACYGLGCKSYVTKPVDLAIFAAVIEKLGQYWFQLVTLPEREA